MSATFTKFTGYASGDICGICLDPLNTMEVSAHDGIHATHTECLEKWLAINRTCIVCRANVTTQSSLSWKDRIVTEIKNLSPLELNIQSLVAMASGTLSLPLTRGLFGLTAIYVGCPYKVGESIGTVASAGIVVLVHHALM